MIVTVVTWNLHGSARPDLDAVADRIRALDADVVALQEVQPRQARTLGRRLRWGTLYWSFKHLPLGKPAEGLAVLSPRIVHDARAVVLSQGQPPWTYRRRIAQLCDLAVAGRRLPLANCHLASDEPAERRAQAERLVAHLGPGTVVAGDLNARPGSDTLEPLLRFGLHDAGPGGATNWRPSDPDDRPTNRLDYVLVPEGVRVTSATVPAAADTDLRAWRRLSDHLPVRVGLDVVQSPAGTSK
ncbi:MAG TPA: endonuclease/exonuclease/phosphatase family protein [Acidimicrobiia bacterium]